MKHVILIKIGGGLITDKSKPFTVRQNMMNASVRAIAGAVQANPHAAFIIGNGGGSFGHFAASLHTADVDGRRMPESVQAIHESVS